MQGNPIRGRLRPAAQKHSAMRVPSMDQRFDLPGPVPLQKSYIVASTPCCGSAFLCTRLWATGVLGAPAQYFGYQKQIGTEMMERLQASSAADYLGKLLSRRTTRNGVFGMSLEFSDFDEALRRFSGMLDALPSLTFIYLDRQDLLAQAAFMAKSAQTDATSAQQGRSAGLRYDRDLISKWLGRIERQKIEWMRWFAANGIVPFVVAYETLIADAAGAVRSVIDHLGVENDERQKLRIALAEKPSDRVSERWAARFKREIKSGIEHTSGVAANAAIPAAARGNRAPAARHIFDRYDQIRGTPTRPNVAKRLRHRYDAIIAQNRDLFKNARVLDLRSGDGRWSLAALDAGASHVVGVDNQQEAVEAASTAFAKIGVEPAAYEFINENMFAGLNSFSPETFDLILCQEVSSDAHFFFKCLRRLKPKHVILDTRIINRKEPILVFRLKRSRKPGAQATGRSGSIAAVPNHELIKTLSDYFGFRWRMIDWQTLGIADWTGIDDYHDDRRRTYVLDWISAPEAD